MEIAKTKSLNSIWVASLSRVDRCSNWISIFICLNKHIPKHCFLFVILNLFNAEFLTWSTINIVKRFHTSSSFCCLITSTDFGPAFLYNLHPNFTLFVSELPGFISCKTKLFYALLVSIKWKPFINNNFQCLSINVEFDTITTSWVVFISQKIISYSFTQLQVCLLLFIFSKTSQSS